MSNHGAAKKVTRWVPVLVAGILIAGIFYFSWIPDPALNHVEWLPRGVARWADQFGNLRTAVPLFFMAMTGGWLLHRGQRPRRDWGRFFVGLVALVGFVELGQLWLPLRHCDWRDVAWGAAGAALGLLPFLCWGRVGTTRAPACPPVRPAPDLE